MNAQANKRDLVALGDLSLRDVQAILKLAAELKEAQRAGRRHARLAGKTLAMIFEKPSLRTRVTFETGMHQLGGHAVYLSSNDIQFGARETVADIARNLSRWVDLIVARTFAHASVLELAREASVPVINGLSDQAHPCQALADYFTLREHKGRLAGLTLTYVGDGNNVVHSLIRGAGLLGVKLRIACPKGYEPDASVIANAGGAGEIVVGHDVRDLAAGADALYTDVWTSMGQEKEAARRRRAFRGYQLDARVLEVAKKDAVVMHCLPAHRGEEISAEVLEGPQSIVFDQAENRLHVQKAILVWLSSRPRAASQGREKKAGGTGRGTTKPPAKRLRRVA